MPEWPGHLAIRRDFGKSVDYHNLAELVAIMSIRCPVHGRRDLGDVVIALALWKKGESFDAEKLKPQVA